MFYKPNQKTQAPLPFTLVQMFLLICLLLSLTVLTAPVGTKQSIRVPSISLWGKLSLLDLLRLELFAPATTCAQQLPYNSPWHNIHLPEGWETPQTALSVIGINKALRKTQIYFASRHLKKEKKACVLATFSSDVYLQLCVKKGQIAF